MRGKLRTEEDRKDLIFKVNKFDLKKTYVWEIKQYVGKRSLSQNALIHVWFSAVAKQNPSYTESGWKEYFKELFIPDIDFTINGLEFKRKKSTSDMTTVELNKFLEEVYEHVWSNAIGEVYYPDDIRWSKFFDNTMGI